jgi:hypothetical protein
MTLVVNTSGDLPFDREASTNGYLERTFAELDGGAGGRLATTGLGFGVCALRYAPFLLDDTLDART